MPLSAVAFAGIVLCIVLGLFKATRVIAVYLASMATCSAGLAFVLACLVFFDFEVVFPDPGDTGDGHGFTWLASVVVAAGFGALVGIATGMAVAHRLTRGRPLFWGGVG